MKIPQYRIDIDGRIFLLQMKLVIGHEHIHMSPMPLDISVFFDQFEPNTIDFIFDEFGREY